MIRLVSGLNLSQFVLSCIKSTRDLEIRSGCVLVIVIVAEPQAACLVVHGQVVVGIELSREALEVVAS